MTVEGLAKKTEEIRQFYDGPLVDFPMGCASWNKPVREFFYGYDIFEQAELAMSLRDEGLDKVKAALKYFGDVEGVKEIREGSMLV
jgi:salicylate hydroxylase